MSEYTSGLGESIGFLLHILPDTEEFGRMETDLELKAPRCFHATAFQMETLAAILPVILPGFWTATLDLKDAYLHIPMHSSARQWLRFYPNGAAYEFRVLPFGLSAVPRTFTWTVKSIAEFLRRRGIHIFCVSGRLTYYSANFPAPRAGCPYSRRAGLAAGLHHIPEEVFPSESRITSLVESIRILMRRKVAVVRL